MQESKYYKRKHHKESDKGWLTKILISVIFVLVSLIYVNFSDKNLNFYKKNILEDNISFASLNNLYKKYVGNVATKENNKENEADEMLTFNEGLIYESIEQYNNSYKLKVGKEYLVSFLKPGIIVFIGEKDGLGNTVIVQGNDGVDIWYSNVNMTVYGLYDYVSEGESLGTSNDEYIYLTLVDDGTYLKYEDYIK